MCELTVVSAPITAPGTQTSRVKRSLRKLYYWVRSCHFMSCHFMSFHVISCHFMSFHFISCHIMYHLTFLTI
jgi:predicted MFS family arabinose efflux permease